MANHLDLNSVIAQLEAAQPPPVDGGFLGARLAPANARLVLIPVPWEATTSYGGGTSQGPAAILSASHQMDLEDAAFGTPYRAGIAFAEPAGEILRANQEAAAPAQRVMDGLERGAASPEDVEIVNAAGEKVNLLVRAAAEEALNAGKLVGLVGGDHSSPFGLIAALAERHPEGFGILHLDAHHDLRQAYEGFTWSHASIFYNVMERLPQVTKLVQLGIRDYSREERCYSAALAGRSQCFYAAEVFRHKASGGCWSDRVNDIIAALPPKVYISFDIDGLEPGCCPSTGTPVPGGLSFDEACFLLEELAAGREVIGFDLCEVAPGASGDEWDANVGARILYKLCGCFLRSQGLC